MDKDLKYHLLPLLKKVVLDDLSPTHIQNYDYYSLENESKLLHNPS